MKRIILIALLPLLIITTSASGQKTYNKEKYSVLPKSTTIFFILGCLDEYIGRGILEKYGDSVEIFYRSEVQVSKVFEKYLRLLVAEESIDTEITKEISEGGHISFHSSQLYHRVNEMYPHSFNKSSVMVISQKYSHGPYIRMARAFISMDVFKGQGKEAKLSYLAGAYARYGYRLSGDRFIFRTSNAGHKIRLIRDLLREFGCTDIIYETSDPQAIPMIHRLEFAASPEVREVLYKASKEVNGRDRRD